MTMPEIRYVCLSDLHFGQETSLLTNLAKASTAPDPSEPSPVLKGLVDCLKSILKACGPKDGKPTLILNGDVLDLALSPLEEAAMAFERFIELVMAPSAPLFDKIITIAGNHDHHLWQDARDTQYVNYMTSGEFPPGARLPQLWNATNVFVESDPLPSYFLQNLIRRFKLLKDLVVPIAYPTFGLLKPERNRAVIFSHGHYMESIYLLMSDLKTLLLPGRTRPTKVWDIEAENGAWIDFFWSAMGNAGEVGEGIETIYDKLNAPDEVTKLICNFVKTIVAKESGIPDVGLMDKVLFHVFSPLVRFISGRERLKSGEILSEEAEKGLRWFVSGPLLQQIKLEFEERKEILKVDGFPEVTLLFGHTHKPFTRDTKFNGYSGWVHTYNTGGWVVDTLDPEPAHGGAVVLIDENLEAVSVRMYNETGDNQKWQIVAETATRGAQNVTGQLFANVDKLLKTKGPWQTFPDTIAECVSIRREHLRNRVFGSR
jgi:hypothetical protein